MSPTVEAAFISAVATIVSVLATATVAILGFRNVRDTNKATLDTTRDGQLADRYSKAIEQLGSTTVDVTIGGIYALEGVARDSPLYHPTVMEVLAACIREHSRERWPEPDPDGTTRERSTRPDIQTALAVIGRRDVKRDTRRIDLSYADLTGAHLTGDLRGADLTGANLTGADLGANLTGADLTNAVLTGADLRGTDLTRAVLSGAHLDHARLPGANLTGAIFIGHADRTGPVVYAADLAGADLRGVDLTGAVLGGADLTGAILADATWPVGYPVPEGWELNTGSGRLVEARTGSEPTGAN